MELKANNLDDVEVNANDLQKILKHVSLTLGKYIIMNYG